MTSSSSSSDGSGASRPSEGGGASPENQDVSLSTKDVASTIEAFNDGWRTAMAVRCTRATLDEVVIEMEVGPQHLQPLGIVHGGVYAGLVEAAASMGAGVNVADKAKYPVGLENHTSFLRAVRSGRLRAIAVPLTRGSRSHVWEVRVLDDADKLVATGRVRLLIIEANSYLAGQGAGPIRE